MWLEQEGIIRQNCIRDPVEWLSKTWIKPFFQHMLWKEQLLSAHKAAPITLRTHYSRVESLKKGTYDKEYHQNIPWQLG